MAFAQATAVILLGGALAGCLAAASEARGGAPIEAVSPLPEAADLVLLDRATREIEETQRLLDAARAGILAAAGLVTTSEPQGGDAPGLVTEAVRVAVVAPIVFPSGSSQITSASVAQVRLAASLLAENPGAVLLEGYAGEEDGPPDARLRLSRQRAEEVRTCLIASGIPAERVHAEGRGLAADEGPPSPEQRASHRRVDVWLVPAPL